VIRQRSGADSEPKDASLQVGQDEREMIRSQLFGGGLTKTCRDSSMTPNFVYDHGEKQLPSPLSTMRNGDHLWDVGTKEPRA
jgi:hypothetical protein